MIGHASEAKLSLNHRNAKESVLVRMRRDVQGRMQFLRDRGHVEVGIHIGGPRQSSIHVDLSPRVYKRWYRRVWKGVDV